MNIEPKGARITSRIPLRKMYEKCLKGEYNQCEYLTICNECRNNINAHGNYDCRGSIEYDYIEYEKNNREGLHRTYLGEIIHVVTIGFESYAALTNITRFDGNLTIQVGEKIIKSENIEQIR